MDVNKIKQLFNNSFIVPFIASLVFVALFNPHTLKAQEVEIDSLKTDSAKVEIKKQPVLINGTVIDSLQSDTLKNVLVDSSLLFTPKRKIIPARAALYSTILPGLGQAYNGKYWKIPIIYTIFGTMFYFASDNHQKYQDFKYAYVNFDDEKNRPIWSKNFEKANLKERMEYYKRNRDYNIIIGGLFYLLNILDASVDAHLMDFDVSDDLSLRIEPELNYLQASQINSNVSGFGIKFVLSLNR